MEVHVTQDVEDKIWFLTDEYNTEWMGILKGYHDGDKYYVTSMVIPRQTNTPVHTRADEPIVGNVVGWVHSHNVMQAYFSEEDIENCEKLPVAIVVNKARQVRCVVKGVETQVNFTPKQEKRMCAREEATGKNFLTGNKGESEYMCPSCTFHQECQKRTKAESKTYLKKMKSLKTWHKKVKANIEGRGKPSNVVIKMIKRGGSGGYGKYHTFS